MYFIFPESFWPKKGELIDLEKTLFFSNDQILLGSNITISASLPLLNKSISLIGLMETPLYYHKNLESFLQIMH